MNEKQIKLKILERFKLCQQKSVELDIFKDKTLDLDVYFDMVNGIVISKYIALFDGEDVINPDPVKVPRTWWQHFKLEKMPKWFNKRFPIKYKFYSIDVKYIYKDHVPIHKNAEGSYMLAKNTYSWGK